jgi:hypothetical protein
VWLVHPVVLEGQWPKLVPHGKPIQFPGSIHF